jgi:hypothetical protein
MNYIDYKPTSALIIHNWYKSLPTEVLPGGRRILGKYHRHEQPEGGTLSQFAFDPDIATMSCYDLLADVQT